MAKLGGEASTEVAASIGTVFTIAADADRIPQWQSTMKSAKVLETDADGRAKLVELTLDAKMKLIRTTCEFTYSPQSGVRWKQVKKGELSALDGSWRFDQLDDNRTRITYKLDVDPGFGLGMLIRGAVEERLRQLLVGDIPGAFKAYVEDGTVAVRDSGR